MAGPPELPGSVSEEIMRARAGAEGIEAQARLMNRYYQTVVEKARRRIGKLGVVDASDVAVSVWDTILRGLPEGRYGCRDRYEFEELLGKITYHKAIGLYQWVKTARRYPSEKLDDSEILQEHPLDEPYRQVAANFYLNGLTEPEIAKSLGVTLEEVRQRLDYVRRRLRKYRYRPTSHIPADALENVAANEHPLDMLLLQELMCSLEDKLRETTLLKLQGLDNRDIAEQLDVSERQIQRRLLLVKNLLESEVASDTD